MIERPIGEVFEFLTKPDNITRWAEAVREAVLTSEGPIAVGATGRTRSRAMGIEVEQDFVVTEYEPNHKYTAKSTSGPFPMMTSYTLEEVEGGVRLHVESEAELGGFIKMAGPILNRIGQKRLESDHKNLKRLLESGA